MYNIIADLHTHSLASTHAYSTIREMVDSAAEKGLKAIAITDHARTMPGAPGPWFFNSMHELPLLYRGILLIAGMEANVIDLNGTLDINETERRDVNWLVASIHNLGLPGLENPTVEKCTQLWLNIAHDPKVNVIGHSGSPEFRYDYETVIPEFGRTTSLWRLTRIPLRCARRISRTAARLRCAAKSTVCRLSSARTRILRHR